MIRYGVWVQEEQEFSICVFICYFGIKQASVELWPLMAFLVVIGTAICLRVFSLLCPCCDGKADLGCLLREGKESRYRGGLSMSARGD